MNVQDFWLLVGLVAAVPLVVGLFLLAMTVVLRVATPALMVFVNARYEQREQEQRYALTSLEREIELAKVIHARL